MYENICAGRCAVFYKGDLLGVSTKNPEISLKSNVDEYSDFGVSGTPLWIQNSSTPTMKIAVELENILQVWDKIANGSASISAPLFSDNLLANSGVLMLTPVNSSNGIALSFPHALLHLNLDYIWKDTAPHSIRIQFLAFPDEARKIMERSSSSSSPSLPVPNALSWRKLEMNLTDVFSREFLLDSFNSWYSGSFTGKHGGHIRIVSESAQEGSWSRCLVIEVKLFLMSLNSMNELLGKLCSTMPRYGFGGFHSLILESAQAVNCSAGGYGATLRILASAPR